MMPRRKCTARLHVQAHKSFLFLVLAAGAVAGCASAAPSLSTSPVSAEAAVTSQAAQPETEAGVRAAATAFYSFYAASLWPQAWALLTPSSQQQVPESLYAAVHEGCPSQSAGMARVIKSVTMAGATAVVTETVAGAAGSLATAADAWQYSGGRWGIMLAASELAVYGHGSAAADIAAAKAAGYCAGFQPSYSAAPVPTISLPEPSFSPLPTMATLPEPTFASPSPLPTLPTAS